MTSCSVFCHRWISISDWCHSPTVVGTPWFFFLVFCLFFLNQSPMHDYNLIEAVVWCDTENVGTDPMPNKYRPHTAGNSTNTFIL